MPLTPTGAKIISTSTAGGWGIFNFMGKHLYWVIVLLVILPAIIASISTAIDTRNPSYPFMQLGIRITNSDAMIAKNIDTLKTNPEELIGMAKPDLGVLLKTKYYWNYFWNVIWVIFGDIWLISVPFVFFYKLFKFKGKNGVESSTSNNLFSAIILGLGFIISINLIILAHSALFNSNILLTIPVTTSFYEETWFIIQSILPFRGIASLFVYLFNFI